MYIIHIEFNQYFVDLYLQVDKSGTGKIGAVDAAAFLKKSGLRETILHKIWELSDPQGRGYLDKQVGVKGQLHYTFKTVYRYMYERRNVF